MTDTQDVNLTAEVIRLFKQQEVSESIIYAITSHNQFTYAQDKPPQVQRALITSILFRLILSLNVPVPKEIRLSLNVATNTLGWLSDLNLVIVPFIKLNEQHYRG